MDVKSASETPIVKKHKKHKHKKHKKQSLDEENPGNLIIVEEIPVSNKMKPSTSKQVTPTSSSNKKRKKRDSATSSDEERWLTAIESGKLEDVDDELKKIKPKDPALMTARQRAMYDRGTDGSPSAPTLMSLPTGYKEKVMTAEAIQKAAIKSQKRKQLADEKREKDKKKTMDRLLKKQESKATKGSKTHRSTRSALPCITYRQSVTSTTLSFPEETDLPLKAAKLNQYPTPKYCSMGCGNLKKYSCSRTGAPLCSLQCYKQNIANRIL